METKSPFKATKLWNQLISSFIEGMELKRRRYRFKSYENSFSGVDALDWMIKYLQNHPSYGDHIKKEQAFTLLQKFMENNVFESVTGKFDQFQDSNCLYKFNQLQEESNDKKIMTVPSQTSITNLLKNVQQDLKKNSSKENTNQSSNQKDRAKTTSSMFEPSDEENLDVGSGFFTRSSSLRLRKPLTSLTNHTLSKKQSLLNNNKTSKTEKKSVSTMPPLKNALNHQQSSQTDRKRKLNPDPPTTTRNTKLSKKLFKTSKTLERTNKVKSLDRLIPSGDNLPKPEDMDISPIKSIYKSQQIAQHFSPSPMRRKLRKSRSSDLAKYRSRSQHDISTIGQNRCGFLYKASSSWDLNNLESSSSSMDGRNFMLSKDRLSPEQLQGTWKSVVLLSLRKLLKMDHVGEYIDEYQISGQNIMDNMECTEKQVKESMPEWLTSAMDCLIRWPNYDNRGVVGGLPNYMGFHCDVLHAIKEHYSLLSEEPLIPCHLTSLLEECMEYADSNIEVTIHVLQYIILLVEKQKRCQFQALVNFMKRVSENASLKISNDLSNKDLMVHSFFRIISRKETHFLVNQTEVLGIRVAYCLMHFYDEIFTAPKGIRIQVDHKIAVIYGTLHQTSNQAMEKKLDASRPSSADAVNKRITKGPVTYCQQITKQEYQRQAVDFSRQEIRNLLRSIVDDRSLPSKEVTRRLAQFKISYPDIYEETLQGRKYFVEGTEATEV